MINIIMILMMMHDKRLTVCKCTSWSFNK